MASWQTRFSTYVIRKTDVIYMISLMKVLPSYRKDIHRTLDAGHAKFTRMYLVLPPPAVPLSPASIS